jgi:hypothetical protein
VSGEVLALLLLAGVHLVGAVLLVGVLLRNDDIPWRSLWPHDDDGGGRGPVAPTSPPDLPLTGATPAPARLREPGRLADAYGRRARRPVREPEPAPEREPVS